MKRGRATKHAARSRRVENPSSPHHNPCDPNLIPPRLLLTTDSATTLQERLSTIERLLGSDPAQAERLATEMLAEVPGHAMALLFQGIARRLTGQPAAAIEVLQPLCENVQDAPFPHLQLGLALRESGRLDEAARSMRRAIAIKPDFSDAWLALAHLLGNTEDTQGLDEAFEGYIASAMQDPLLREIAAALDADRLADAEQRLRRRLESYPKDVVALRMLATVAVRTARFDDAETLLQATLELAPGYLAARHDYAGVLVRQTRPAEALAEVERLLASEPANVPWRKLKAAILLHLLDYAEAAAEYEALLREQPDDAGLHASLGHCLRIMGRREESIDAYRRAIALAPQAGEAYWNLANLKTYRITDAELDAMRRQLAKAELGNEARTHLHFAMGKALEDRGEFEESFRHYDDGNRTRRRNVTWDAEEFSGYVNRCVQLFTKEFFAERAGFGADSTAPIFVVGLPRSGSTLVEQILASHSQVEGTTELPQVKFMAARLARRVPAAPSQPAAVAEIGDSESRELGQEYVQLTRPYRKLETPWFIDKTPNNFEHLGLIALMLPRARIVDVRRQPMACGLSVFKHLFARGQHFSYSLEDIGRYYGDYVRLMKHFDSVLPERVHRLSYEALVQDTEAETRRLLDYLELPFEASCLRFHENPRTVSTPSSEQVRSPIFSEGLDHWRHYEPWLEPLESALAASGGSVTGPRDIS